MLGSPCSPCCKSCPRTDKPSSIEVVIDSTMSDSIVAEKTSIVSVSDAGEPNVFRQIAVLAGGIAGTYTLSHVPELDYEVIDGAVSSISVFKYQGPRLALSMVVTTGDYGLPYSGGSAEIQWRLFVYVSEIRVVTQGVWINPNSANFSQLVANISWQTYSASDVISQNLGGGVVTQVEAIALSQTCAQKVATELYGEWPGDSHPFSASRSLLYGPTQAKLPVVGITSQSYHDTGSMRIWDYFSPGFPVEVTGHYDLYLLLQYTPQQVPFDFSIESIKYIYEDSERILPL